MPENMNKDLDQAYVKFDDLSVGYNGKAIIHDICIDIKKGEIVALIGPNGAGKSTILKTLTKQLSIIKGDVGFEGKSMHKIPNKELSQKMAVVLTERLKTDLLTCYDVVASGRYPYTGKLGILMPEDEQKVDEAIAAVHATELGPRDFNAISDGQRQRILLARAICQDPELIVLDEPTSFLDIKYKLELLSILRNMAKKRDITVITSLHEIDLAMKIADKIICVKGDHIYRYGAPDEIFDEDMIRKLYDIDNGFFDPLYGSIELPAPTGEGWKRHLTDSVAVERPAAEEAGSAADGAASGAGSAADGAASDKEPADHDKTHNPDRGNAPYAFVISSGGGGIPVTKAENNHLKGSPAVIDKDRASELLAEELDADFLIVLTAVENAMINYKKPDEKKLGDITVEEAKKYIAEGQFAPGSMLPKVEAAVKFAESKPGRVALITLLEKAKDGINGKTGTRIHA